MDPSLFPQLRGVLYIVRSGTYLKVAYRLGALLYLRIFWQCTCSTRTTLSSLTYISLASLRLPDQQAAGARPAPALLRLRQVLPGRLHRGDTPAAMPGESDRVSKRGIVYFLFSCGGESEYRRISSEALVGLLWCRMKL